MNMQQIMKQAQKMQQKMMEVQEEAGREISEASVGGGMVKVRVNGKQEVLAVEIEKEIVNPEDVEMLQDLILAGVNEALKKSKESLEGKMKAVTGGLGINLPGMF